jgi:hypothetical protein
MNICSKLILKDTKKLYVSFFIFKNEQIFIK